MRAQSKYLEIAAIVILCGILAYQLFVPPIVGLASNGDYERITDAMGLKYESPPKNENEYLVRRYVRVSPHNWSGYHSSEMILVKLAMEANRVLSKDDIFDLTIMGLIHSVIFVLGMAGIFFGVRALKVPYRFVVYGLALVMFGDAGYVAYFNSFYSEPGSIIFLITTIACGLAAALASSRGHQRLYLSLGFFASAALFVCAKPQNALLGLPLAAFGLRLLLTSSGVRRPLRSALSAALPGALIAVSLTYALIGQPSLFREDNLYNMVFVEILPHSSQPAQDLRELGLPASYIRWSGTDAFSANGANSDALFRQTFVHQIGYADIGLFYARHPLRFMNLARRGAGSAFNLRPSYLGNFERSSGYPPYYQSKAFDTWTNLQRRFFPASLLTIVVFITASLATAVVGWRRQRRPNGRLLILELHMTVLAMTVLQFGIVLLGEGEYEIVKHLLLFNALFDLCIGFALVHVLFALSALRRRAATAWFNSRQSGERYRTV